MPTLDDLAAQTIGEQEWRILRLEDENRHLREEMQALRVTPVQENIHASPLQGPESRHGDRAPSS